MGQLESVKKGKETLAGAGTGVKGACPNTLVILTGGLDASQMEKIAARDRFRPASAPLPPCFRLACIPEASAQRKGGFGMDDYGKLGGG